QHPLHNRRLPLATSVASYRPSINPPLTLGHSRISGSIIPSTFDFFWPPPPPAFNAARAKQLLAEAGYPNGFDAGDYFCDSSYANLGEAVANNLQAVGIRVKLRPLERVAFFSGYSEKKFKNLIQGSSGAFGNAATRLEALGGRGAQGEVGRAPQPLRRSLGSQASRSVSPKRLKPKTDRLMARPGKMASHGACSMKARPVLDSIKPHDGVGGCVPTPRKLSDASMRMALPSQMEARMRMGAVTWGRRWMAMIGKSLQPMACAAATKRFCCADSTAPRTTRELPGIMTMAMASMALVVLGVSTDTTARARMSPGMVIIASMNRWSTRSRRPSQ